MDAFFFFSPLVYCRSALGLNLENLRFSLSNLIIQILSSVFLVIENFFPLVVDWIEMLVHSKMNARLQLI